MSIVARWDSAAPTGRNRWAKPCLGDCGRLTTAHETIAAGAGVGTAARVVCAALRGAMARLAVDADVGLVVVRWRIAQGQVGVDCVLPWVIHAGASVAKVGDDAFL